MNQIELILQNVAIKRIGPVEDVGSNGFQKRDVDVETPGQYPQVVRFQFDGGHINKPDAFKVGEIVSISFNVKGREWVNPQGNTVVFTTLQAWKIAHTSQAPAPAAAANPQPATPTQTAANFDAPAFNEEEHDDLPF